MLRLLCVQKADSAIELCMNIFQAFGKKYIDNICAVCYHSNMNNRLRKVKITKRRNDRTNETKQDGTGT